MAHGTCSIDGCGNSGLLRRGWCNMHYLRWRRHGDPTFAKTIWGDDEARFWSKVDKTDGCWLWTGTVGNRGYGQIKVQGRKVQAHRYAYESQVGPVPDGLQLDHLCRVRRCVRVDHLEPVTPRENTRRGVGPTAPYIKE